MPSPSVSFRLNKALQENLSDRVKWGASLGVQAQSDLARYYALVDRSLKKLSLNRNEALLLCDALNGEFFDPCLSPDAALLLSVESAIEENGLDAKWGADRHELLEKLANFNSLEAMAAIDATERFWKRPTCGEETLREVERVFKLGDSSSSLEVPESLTKPSEVRNIAAQI
jgi:hypothetical protein